MVISEYNQENNEDSEIECVMTFNRGDTWGDTFTNQSDDITNKLTNICLGSQVKSDEPLENFSEIIDVKSYQDQAQQSKNFDLSKTQNSCNNKNTESVDIEDNSLFTTMNQIVSDNFANSINSLNNSGNKVWSSNMKMVESKIISITDDKSKNNKIEKCQLNYSSLAPKQNLNESKSKYVIFLL